MADDEKNFAIALAEATAGFAEGGVPVSRRLSLTHLTISGEQPN